MQATIPTDAYVMIIGAMKCGTSSFYQYLVEHPQICAAAYKEPEYFSETQRRRVDIANYQDLWDFNSAQHHYVIEAYTGYTKYLSETNIVKNIVAANINPKFIYIVKNPFDRIISHYNFMRREGYFDLQQPVDSGEILTISNYWLQLSQYLGELDKEQFLILDFDQIKHDPHAALNTVFDFLDLEKLPRQDSYPMHNTTPELSVLEMRIMRLLPRRWHRYIPSKLLLKLSKPLPKKTLSQAEHASIHAKLNADIQRFGEEFCFDVGKWGF